MSRLAYVLMMMWIAGLALGLPAGMVTHGSKAGAKGVRVIDANDNFGLRFGANPKPNPGLRIFRCPYVSFTHSR